MAKKTFLLFFLVIFLSTTPIQAGVLRPDEIFEMSLAELMDIEVVTATRTAQKLSEAPANMIVITKRQIKERGYVNLLDLIQDLPNVDVHKNAGEEFFSIINFRGSENQTRFVIMQDNKRINSPTSDAVPIAGNFPLYNAEQVEIIFGPGSALYGADAFAGIINIITQEAEEIDGAVMSSSIGQYGHYYDYLNVGKKLAENVNFSFGGHWNHSDNADLSKYYPKEFEKTDLKTYGGDIVRTAENREKYYFGTGSYSAYAKLDIDRHFTLGFNQSYFRGPTTAGVRPEMSVFGPEEKWETLIRDYYGEYRLAITDNLSGKSTLSYSTYEVLPDSKYKNIYVDFNDAYKYAHSKKFMLEQQVNYRISDKHQLVVGVSWEDFYSLPKTYDLSWPYNRSLPSSMQGYTYIGTTLPVKIFELNYSNIAGYAQWQSKWTNMISSTIGVRYDYNSRYGKTINPRAGLIVKPWEPTTVKILYGEAYFAPTPYIAYQTFGAFTGATNANGEYISNFFNIPNPDLKPEKARTPEISISQEINPDFNLTLSGYYLTLSNMTNYVNYNTTSNYIEGGEILSWRRYENFGKTILYGGDLRADYHMQIGNADLKVWGNYSFADGYVDDTINPRAELILVAKNKIKGGLTATFANHKYFITPMFRWIGETQTRWKETNDKTKRVRVDDYVVVDLNSGVNDLFIPGLSAYLNVRNLLDNRYYNAAGGGSNFRFSPQDPICVTGTLEYKY
ncbi:MAG: TonB-dependent receptor [Nitrospinae bacterium]|nr:TonB-dependent receptor [Nitrospinota bacterium]